MNTMMGSKAMIRVGTAAAAMLLVVATCQASTIRSVRWSSAEGAASRTLRVELAGAADGVAVRERADGVAVRAGALAADLALPDGVGLEAGPDGAPGGILISPPGTRLVAFRVEGGAIEVDVYVPGLEGIEGYRLGPGDVVNVAVYEDKSLTDDYTIGQDGAINLPLAGAVQAVGLTEVELAARVRAALDGYIDNATVSATIIAFQSQSMYVNVTGDSPRATKVTLRPGMRLSDALAEAGVALLPGQRVELLKTGPGGERDRIELTYSEIDAADAPRPQNRDVLNVLEPEYVFIRGEVRSSGRWLFRPGLTLQQLIALAGGLSDWASRKDIRVHRETASGPVDIDVNLRRIEDGSDPDFELAPGDLVLVRRRVL